MVFYIEDDAYNKLQLYLDSITAKYIQTPDGQEIIDDIEARIAELCDAKLTSSKQVITINDVNDIIGVLGDLQEVDFENENTFNDSSSYKYKTGKHIYRDSDNKLIGGVAAGLASYFGVSTVLVRIVLVVTFLIFGPFLYLALWIIIPEAYTVAQKLEMRGEPVNIKNIEKAIRNEWFEVKKNFIKFKKNKKYAQIEEKFDFFLKKNISKLRPFIVWTMLLFALVLLILIIIFIANIIGSTAFNFDFFESLWDLISSVPFPTFSGSLIDSFHFNVLLFGVFLIIVFPTIGLLVTIFKNIIGLRNRNWVLGLFFFFGLTLGLTMIIYVAVIEGKNFKAYNEDTEDYTFCIEHNYNIMLSKDLYDNNIFRIRNNKNNEKSYYFDTKNFGLLNTKYMITSTDGLINISVTPILSIHTSPTDSLYIRLIKGSQGKDMEDAFNNISSINYNFEISDSTMLLDPMFTIDNTYKWRAQKMYIELYIPIGTKINFSKAFNTFFNEEPLQQNSKNKDLSKKNWVISDDGLREIK